MSSTHVLHAWHVDLYIKNVWGVYFFKMYTYVSETKDEEMMLGCCVFCHLFIGKCSMCDTCTETAGV